MLALRGYFDESDTEATPVDQIFTLGGWVADVDTWERFAGDWEKVLREEPPIRYFKHHEAKGLSGEFLGWSAADADGKIMSLARVTDEHIDPTRNCYGIVTGIKPELLRFVFRNSPATPKQARSVLKCTTPYHFCFFNLTACVAQHELELGHGTPVDFVFDEGADALASCIAVVSRNRHLISPGIASIVGKISEGNDKEVAPLQAADLLVGQVSTMLKQGHPDAPWKVLSYKPRILFNPITTGRQHNKILQGFASTVELFNVSWSSLMLERITQKTSRSTRDM